MSELQNWYATGRRKTSVARVWLKAGSGSMTINGNTAEGYLCRPTLKMMLDEPFELTETKGRYDVTVNVQGGGLAGQAGAIQLGITRALMVMNPQLRATLKKAGMVTRDSRAKERKKYGQPAARKRFQYSKR